MSARSRTEIGTHSSAPDTAEGARSSVTTADGSTAAGTNADSRPGAKKPNTHDPLCPVIEPDEVFFRWGCQCALIAKVRADERVRVAIVEQCGHTKYVGCPPCEHDVIDEPTTCARGCRDGLVRVLSASGDDTEVDLCPCQR